MDDQTLGCIRTLAAARPGGRRATLRAVFGGIEQAEREIRADGSIGHADVRIGDSLVMLSEATAEYPSRPCVNFVYLDDVDAAFQKALRAGATPLSEPSEQPWGDRVGGFHDPFDNRWWVATYLRDSHSAGCHAVTR
jgi:PhnB protein